MHSLSVYDVLMEKHFDEETDSLESFTICALLHDLCKAQFYKVSTRNVKTKRQATGKKFHSTLLMIIFPMVMVKICFLIERFMRLRIEEAMAIRWHMGGFEDNGGFTISLAYRKYPLAVKLHLADLESTYLREKDTSVINTE